MKYLGNIKINKKDKKYYEKLLNNISNGYKDDFICLGSCKFNNNYKIYIDLLSGDSNYYLQYVLYDNKEHEVYYDTLDTLDNFEIEEDNNIYKVCFEIE